MEQTFAEIDMQMVFRKFPPGEELPPASGEIYIRAGTDSVQDGQGMAARVCKDGLAWLPQGAGPLERLVVDAAVTHPTFDDMLAAAFVQELVEGRSLPAGCQAFAEYAAVVRRGLRPANLPPEDSLEGIFLAIRNAAGKDADLTNAATGERFRKDWWRLADCILKAAQQGANPLTSSPCAGRPEFMRERAFLLRDQEVYRQDVLRGQRWLVRLAGGPEQTSGLFLRQPTSLLFPYWSRSDNNAPAGGAYLFLAVCFGDGAWVFSTDPAQQLPIRSLAEALQAAETARAPEEAARDPWYDGKRPEHGYTLAAAPRQGTKLAEAEVLRIVKKWAKAKPPARSRSGPRLAAAAAVLLVLGGLAWWGMTAPNSTASKSALGGDPVADQTEPRPRLAQPVSIVNNKNRSPTYQPRQKGPVVRSLPADAKEASWKFPVSFTDPYAIEHSARLWVQFEIVVGPSMPAQSLQATLRVNGVEAKVVRLAPELKAGRQIIVLEAGEVVFGPAGNDIEVRLTNPDAQEREVNCTVEWRPRGKLYALAVGVSEYADPAGNLLLPRVDAEDLVKAFQTEEGQLFSKVECRTLTDGKARREDILTAMTWLEKNCKELDTVVVSLAGHGEVTDGGRFVFAPHDYDFNNKDLRCLKDVDFLDKLAGLPCNVLLLLDCCHSGAFPQISTLDVRTGLLVFAAARSNEKAGGTTAWGHGALTLAVLEGIQNRWLYPLEGPDKPREPPFPANKPLHHAEITLEHLRTFVSARVRELTRDQQAFTDFKSRDMAPQQIPIALQGGP
jgi:hypothetical protein